MFRLIYLQDYLGELMKMNVVYKFLFPDKHSKIVYKKQFMAYLNLFYLFL